MRAFWYSELLTMLPPETSLPLLPRTACDRPVVCRACCIDCLIFLRASIAAAVAAADVNPEASDDTMDSCPLGGVPADISLDGVPTDPPEYTDGETPECIDGETPETTERVDLRIRTMLSGWNGSARSDEGAGC